MARLEEQEREEIGEEGEQRQWSDEYLVLRLKTWTTTDDEEMRGYGGFEFRQP